MIVIKTKLNPAIMFGQDGKTYAVGGKWIEVPNGTTINDILWDKPSIIDRVKPTGKSIKVKGSKGNEYIVSYNPTSKVISCTCTGYQFRKKCKHQKELK